MKLIHVNLKIIHMEKALLSDFFSVFHETEISNNRKYNRHIDNISISKKHIKRII